MELCCDSACFLSILQGFRLIFSFSQNPYFSNKQLVKTYYMAEEDESNPILQKATGTTIDWASGKNPGVKVSFGVFIAVSASQAYVITIMA